LSTRIVVIPQVCPECRFLIQFFRICSFNVKLLAPLVGIIFKLCP